MTATRAMLVLALVPLSWLLPNHYPPWVSAWHEGLALFLLALAALLAPGPTRASLPWLAAGATALGSIAAQALGGRIAFGGDAVVAITYVAALLLALWVGDSVLRTSRPHEPGTPSDREATLCIWAAGVYFAATLCVAIALLQWTESSFAHLWIVDLPPRAQPYSNLAQPNHFNTAVFLGLTSLGVLREAGRIGSVGWWSGASFMVLGTVMSGSRTALIQWLVAIALVAWFSRPAQMRLRIAHAAGLVPLYVALRFAWTSVDNVLGGQASRSIEAQGNPGTRPDMWQDMMAAISREPLSGYGWLQVDSAQQAVALDRPPLYFEHTAHAHNLILDLLIWAGVPIGGLLVLLCAVAIWIPLRKLSDPRAVWLMIGALAVLTHGMLEFPLEYAYFLIPFGVSLGMVNALASSAYERAIPAWCLRLVGAAVLCVLGVLGIDYFKAEESFRLVRLETARIGTDRIVSKAPDLLLLTQLEALLGFIRTEAKPGMSAGELEQMRLVSRRYGFAPAQFRYALALGLNGQPEEAAKALRRLCHIHPVARCDEARQVWPTLQQRFEVLRAVPAP